MKRWMYVLILLMVFLAGCGGTATTTSTTPAQTTTQSSLKSSTIPGLLLPAGFQISAYATGLHTPRLMTIGPDGTLLIANRGDNSIVALLPGKSPERAAKQQTIVRDLHDPTSLDMHDGYLYIGEGSDIARVKLDATLQPGPIERIITDLPLGGQHSTRTVLVGPDNHIYVAIGSDCNVCQESDPHRAAIWVYNLDGSHGRLYAKGLRNAVGMQVNPWNQQIWITNNGRDNLGDNIPPETIYHLVDGGNYGWPACHAGTIIDPQFGNATSCQGIQQPLVKMQAHSAPLGLAFYTDQPNQFPQAFRNSLYVAFHGSWNRSEPTGYKVVRIPLNTNGSVAGTPQDFLSGFLQNDGKNIGRPVGVTIASDGTMFISDDTDNTIYHIWYQG